MKQKNKNLKEKSMLQKCFITGIGIAVLIIGANIALMGSVGLAYFSAFPMIDSILSLFFLCQSEKCFGMMLFKGSLGILIITPFIWILLRYIFDLKKFPFNKNKIITASLIFILFILQIGISNLEKKADIYAYEAARAKMQNRKYYSLDDCRKDQPYEIIGNCYGYFAGMRDDINLCNEYLKNTDAPDKNVLFTECIISYSAYKNNIANCNNITGDKKEFNIEKCRAKYYIAKNQYAKCSSINNIFWIEECLKNTRHANANTFVKKYAERRGLVWKYEKYESEMNRLK